MKLRLYRTDRDTISGKIVLNNTEVRSLFGRVPSRDRQSISNHFRVRMGLVESRRILSITHADIPENTSRLEAPWLRPYGKSQWFITPVQSVAYQLSMSTYGKEQGTDRDAFVELDNVFQGTGSLRASVALRDTDVPEPEPELSPEQKAYAALKLVNEYVAANPGRLLLSVHNNQASIWTQAYSG